MKKLKYLFPSSWNIISLSFIVGILMYFCAELFLRSIRFITNLSFTQHLSFTEKYPINPYQFSLIIAPIVGALVLGALARYYDDRIRGHGIPEVMERIESYKSNIPFRLLWLRPIACAISIGTGGPYGAEGPVIGMGAALGSLIAQQFKLDDEEKKTLLAAGAAAGISAVFGTPVGAVFLVAELFLKSHAIKSLIPIGVASIAAYAMRATMDGTQPLFPITPMHLPITLNIVLAFAGLAIFLGIMSALLIHAIDKIEHLYEALPIHWMWWPVIGILPLCGFAYFYPNLLGPSYDLLESLFVTQSDYSLLIKLAIFKGIVWMFAVSSRTTAGTLAPLIILGSGLGLFIFTQEAQFLSIPIEFFAIAAVIGGGAFFGSISGAPITSALMVLEMTGSMHLLTLSFGTCLIAVLVTKRLASKTIMQSAYT